MKDITHIERPNLPWRNECSTECGLDAVKHPTWTRAEAIAKFKELGRQRFSLFVCMTCFNTANRHSTWEEDPASCMLRYCEKHSMRWRRDDDGEHRHFADELRALAMLVEAHRAEFDELVGGLGDATDLSALRTAKQAAKRARRG